MKKAAVKKVPRKLNKWIKASAVRVRMVGGQPVLDIRQAAPKKKANPKKRAVYRAVRKRTSKPKAARRR